MQSSPAVLPLEADLAGKVAANYLEPSARIASRA
jgi:hypothetical protein